MPLIGVRPVEKDGPGTQATRLYGGHFDPGSAFGHPTPVSASAVPCHCFPRRGLACCRRVLLCVAMYCCVLPCAVMRCRVLRFITAAQRSAVRTCLCAALHYVGPAYIYLQ